MIKHKQHLRRGFTVIELAVVITVIGILVTIVALSYRSVQQASRDNQREADITAFRASLDKFYDENGVYPPSCISTYECGSNGFFQDNTTAPINQSTSLATLKTLLPNLPSSFGDPTTGNTPSPITNTSSSVKKYFYYGGIYFNANHAIAGAAVIKTWSTFPCTLAAYVVRNSSTSYVAGYFSESEDQWKLYGGKSGSKFSVSGPTGSGCKLLP